MPRVARIVLPGLPNHVTQRGNNRQDVFFVPDDYRTYLNILREQSERHGVRLQGYCLMTNHVHLIATPPSPEALAKAVGRTNYLYTLYVNRLHGRTGHLWQNRFYSCALDEVHAWRALRYVERNPVRAKCVRLAWRYRWSSAAAHCGQPDALALADPHPWSVSWRPARWKETLTEPDDAADVRRLRLCTHRGRPLADDSFLSKLERRLGRRLRPKPVGRPKQPRAKKPASEATGGGKGRGKIGDCP